MGDKNPIRTLGDYSKPSHESYRNTIELPERNNVVPLRSDTIRLVQNGCSFHALQSEDPNQHLKDFLKLVDSLDLNGDNRERTRLGKLRDRNAKESCAFLEDLTLYDNESWNDPRDFAKPEDEAKEEGNVKSSTTEYEDHEMTVESEEEFEEETKEEIEKEEEDSPKHFDTFPTMKELRLCLTKRSLEVLRKFHWMTLGGRGPTHRSHGSRNDLRYKIPPITAYCLEFILMARALLTLAGSMLSSRSSTYTSIGVFRMNCYFDPCHWGGSPVGAFVTILHSAGIAVLLCSVTTPFCTRNLSIPCVGDGTAWIFLRTGRLMILLYGEGDQTTMKFIKDFQDSPNDEKDTRSSQEYIDDLKEEYQARALLDKSKRFFRKGTQSFSSTKATDQTECHTCGRKGHLQETVFSKTPFPSY
nr:retrovirus-related Pol polyprotein from transposon TNT 1-94 [Tanacetum cinerariifolium]